jgi:hypothetical protein
MEIAIIKILHFNQYAIESKINIKNSNIII